MTIMVKTGSLLNSMQAGDQKHILTLALVPVFHLEKWFEETQGGEANTIWGRS